MTRCAPLLIAALLIASSADAQTHTLDLRRVDFSDIEHASWTANGSRLSIEQDQDAGPLTVELLRIIDPPITSSRYIVRGHVTYEDVQPAGYLEMWSVFPDGSRYFSRTLGEFGPMASLKGFSSNWRVFELPFDATGAGVTPSELVINLVLPGAGRVDIGPELSVESLTQPTVTAATGNASLSWAILLSWGPALLLALLALGVAVLFIVTLATGRTRAALVMLFIIGLLWIVVAVIPGLLFMSILFVPIVAAPGAALLVLATLGLHRRGSDSRHRLDADGELRKMQAMDAGQA